MQPQATILPLQPPVKHLLTPGQKKIANLIANNLVNNIIKKANEKGNTLSKVQ